MNDPRSEVNLVRSSGERLQLLPTSEGDTDATGAMRHPFGFECVLADELPVVDGLQRIRADYEGFPTGDDGNVESTERPANWFPADMVFWSNVPVVRSWPHDC